MYSFCLNKHTSCLYNRYWTICKCKLNYAHETAASIIIIFLMAKCERIVHKSLWVICPVQRQHGNIPTCWLFIAQAHGAACLVSDLCSFFRFLLHRTFQTELWSYVIIKTKSYIMLIHIALLFLLYTTGSFKIYQLPSLVTMHYDSYLRWLIVFSCSCIKMQFLYHLHLPQIIKKELTSC